MEDLEKEGLWIPAIIVCYIYWDYENCQKGDKTKVDYIIWALKKMFSKIVKNKGCQIEFRVAYNPEHQKTTLTDEFIASFIIPKHVGPEEHAADNALISNMVEQTENHPAPGIVVLITSDGGPTKVSNGVPCGGFAEQLKKMRDLKYFICLLHQTDCSEKLLSRENPIVHVPLLWPSLMETLRGKTMPLKVVQCYNTSNVRGKGKRTYDENDEEAVANQENQEASTSSKSVPQKMKKHQL